MTANIYKIPLQTALIDSFSLKIPLKDVQVLDERLTSKTAIYYESLDMVETEATRPPEPIIKEENGIKVRFSLIQVPVWNHELKQTEPTEMISLTISTKLLKELYFQGININNVKTLYDSFIDMCVFDCTFTTFLTGYISDIDICMNIKTQSPLIFSGACHSLLSQSAERAKHARLFEPNDGTAIGLQFNNRNWAKPSLPFVKLYHKEIELKNRSLDFYETYLKENYGTQIDNLTRIEATIKNYDHRKRLKKFGILPDFKTLGDFLKVPEKNLNDFISFSLGAYVITKSRLKAPDLSPTDFALFELLQCCVLKGYDEETLLALTNGFKCDNEKSQSVAQSRLKTKFKTLLKLANDLDGTIRKKSEQNKLIIEYLKILGVEF